MKEKLPKSKWRVPLRHPYFTCTCHIFDKSVCNVCQGIREFVVRRKKK